MKKFLIGTGIAIGALLVAIFLLGLTEAKVENHTLEEVEAMFKDEETFLLVIGQASCSACRLYKENGLKAYVKDEGKYLPLRYLDMEKELRTTRAREAFFDDYDIPTLRGTPSTYLVVDGKVQGNGTVGAISLDDILEIIEPAL